MSNPQLRTMTWLALACCIHTQMPLADAGEQRSQGGDFSPYPGRDYPTEVFFGDTHLHTGLSMDAAAFGNRLGLDDAYRFSRGEEVVSSTGTAARLGRPLDFVVVADHSDGMGFFDMFYTGDPIIMEDELGRRWHKMVNEGGQSSAEAALEIITTFSQGKMPWATNDPAMMQTVWQSTVDAAEKYNDPGKFTAFIGYEWTSLVKGNNLHRVVVYRDGGDRASQTLPFTLADSADPEDLWNELARYEDVTGGKVLAIPHNGNLSNGLMFDLVTLSGEPLDQDYARSRQRWEPLYETTQIKGDGEAHPLLSPDDKYADYETWDLGNLDLSEAKADAMLPGEYARSGLKRGLELEASLGINPYKYGQIGSTDSHTSLAAVEEDNFFGKHSAVEPGPERYEHVTLSGDNGTIMATDMVASGYAAVWAAENTREAIFDAMMRKETYATTGPRMTVRFFGGWNYAQEDAVSPHLADIGYSKGVPMGGDLPTPGGEVSAPTFLVAAMKDVVGANLDRIQVVKGWLDSDGVAQERVYDVAVSDKRKIDRNGRCNTPVGSTVDVSQATWSNSIGDADLAARWVDPEFDPQQKAFYYVRVLEIPTPRWTAYEAERFNLELDDDVEMQTQERAYTAPIWYTP